MVIRACHPSEAILIVDSLLLSRWVLELVDWLDNWIDGVIGTGRAREKEENI